AVLGLLPIPRARHLLRPPGPLPVAGDRVVEAHDAAAAFDERLEVRAPLGLEVGHHVVEDHDPVAVELAAEGFRVRVDRDGEIVVAVEDGVERDVVVVAAGDEGDGWRVGRKARGGGRVWAAAGGPGGGRAKPTPSPAANAIAAVEDVGPLAMAAARRANAQDESSSRW